ncbi:hypothetical protein DAI22_11g165701 [Oryza sativa Japonica Group]|nr:hypothetical protein DAI22_11g165701 [Oryza sativa Japonica Group]
MTMRTVHDNPNIRIFTEGDIERITNNYSTLIGKGGFGEIFRGVLDDEDDMVAVKRYIRGDLRDEFMEEVRIHAQVTHKNIVKVIGYCIGKKSLMMVTEFISNGNLEYALHNSGISIPLGTRFGIAIGCVEALSYMHSMHLSSGNLICHGDIKPTNILLDGTLIAKVADFGLSKSLSGGITRYTENVKGSIDYMDPIYLSAGRVTRKSDIYSFGVVLLELISQKRVKEKGGINLIAAFNQAYANGKGFRGLLDTEIANECNMKILEGIGKLAVECVAIDANKRPNANDVEKRLLMLWAAQHGKEENIIRRLYRRSPPEIISSSSSNKLGNARIFREGELKKVTENYSSHLATGSSYNIYKGTLEDNTLVAVKKYFDRYEAGKEEFRSRVAMVIMSPVVHKNITKLLGICLEANPPTLVYEYAARNLSDILHCKEDFPLELRLKIASKTSRVLEHLHSSRIALRHGDVMPSNILLDDGFVPKVTAFTLSTRFTEDNATRMSMVKGDGNYMDPYYRHTNLVLLKSDVYSFGVVLLELITRKQPAGDCPEKYGLVSEFARAYKMNKSGKAMFDERIATEENIPVLEEIGKLALHCINLKLSKRPTMKEVAERLKKIRRWCNGHEGYRMLIQPECTMALSRLARGRSRHPDATGEGIANRGEEVGGGVGAGRRSPIATHARELVAGSGVNAGRRLPASMMRGWRCRRPWPHLGEGRISPAVLREGEGVAGHGYTWGEGSPGARDRGEELAGIGALGERGSRSQP